jgi:hypothetical protein
MSNAISEMTLAEWNKKNRALRRPNIPPSELPQPGEWNGKGEYISPTPAVSQSVLTNAREVDKAVRVPRKYRIEVIKR